MCVCVCVRLFVCVCVRVCLLSVCLSVCLSVWAEGDMQKYQVVNQLKTEIRSMTCFYKELLQLP